MKYPQLVSSRAVNAISDWLVSRLEQLGVEAPQIYTRLLLSLLQSSVQINDPIEFSNLETYFGNRKGQNRRYHLTQCDTDTLKKLNAIQCLKEIVSNEQEIDTIENLVDELCEKLKDIEKQLADTEDAENPLVALTLTVTQKVEGGAISLRPTLTKEPVPAKATAFVAPTSSVAKQPQRQQQAPFKSHSSVQRRHANPAPLPVRNASQPVRELLKEKFEEGDNDPKKRYFNAFPALSKEMEESFRVWRRNAKSLTWPVNSGSGNGSQAKGGDDKSAGGGGAVLKFSEAVGNRGSVASGGGVKPKRSEASEQHACSSGSHCGEGGGLANLDNCDKEPLSGLSGGGGAKRKSKRRRNRALSKGRNIPNLRKSSICSNPVVSGGSGGNSSNSSVTSGAGGGKRLQQHQHRPKASSPFWDTNFEGCWEMGPDLIQEFFAKQKNKGNNNRRNQPQAAKMRDALEGSRRNAASSREVATSVRDSPLMPVVDISFCCGDDDDDDLDYDDTLMTIAELPMDKPGATAKRLYERETASLLEQPQSLLSSGAPEKNDADDIAVFTSKFNSDVEALWKDAPAEELADDGPGPMFAFAALPCVAPFKENLMNFWSNYYGMDQESSVGQDQAMTGWGGNLGADDSLTTTNSQSLSCSGSGSALNCDLANTSDYYSMPSNLDDFEKSVGVVGRRGGLAGGARGNQAAAEEEGRHTPVGLFLQNSIWSENSCNATGGDTDESFYMKVWNSNKKLNQLEAANKTNAMEHGNASGAFIYPPYNNSAGSKWSEGINAGPPPPPPVSAHSQLSSHTASSGSLISNYNNNPNQLGVDCPDSVATTASNSNTASVSTTSCSSSYAAAAAYQWQTPVIGQNLQADLTSWSASNPKSLTDVYGGAADNCPDLMMQGKATNAEAEEDQVDAIGSSISLPNHLANGASGFVEYARIKPLMQALTSTAAAAYPPLNASTASAVAAVAPDNAQQFADDDDLLTSERTHFHPIRSYSDGHTFDICSSIDVIPYERSASGEYMYLEGDRYMEYKRPDNYIVEDDGTSGTASSNPLYGKRYAAEARGPEDFSLKFRVRQTDFACQANEDTIEAETDAATRYYAEMQRQREQHPLALIYAGASHPLHASPEALNKAVAAAAKAAAAAHVPTGSHWMPIRSEASGSVGSAFLPSVWTSVQVNPTAAEELSCDEVDFLDARAGAGANGTVAAAPSLMDENSTCSLQCPVDHQWSMREVGQNCCGGHNNNDNNMLNNNNNNYDSLDNSRGGGGGGDQPAGPHTLWGMCAACNGELKSVPANRLLRDELQQEADEIMSDLKYMQDLYIGRSSEEDDEEPLDAHDEEEDDADDEDEVNVTHITERDMSSEVDDDGPHLTGSEDAETLPCGGEGDGDDDDDNESEVMAANFDLGLGPKTAARDKRAKYWKESMMHVEAEEAEPLPASLALQQPNETHIVLQKVNRLIADLLRPENAMSSPPSQTATADAQTLLPYGHHEGGDATPPLSGDELADDKQFSAGIWYGKNERNIWQSSGMLDSNTLKPMELLRHFQIDPADSALTKATAQNEDYLKLELNWEHENLSKIWNGEQNAAMQRSEASQERARAQREEVEVRGQKEDKKASSNASAFKRMQQFLQSNGPNMAAVNASSAGGKKLTNRKRRHSASQNFFHQSAMALAFHNNNNSVDVADLNVNSMKHFVSGTAADLNGLQKLMHLAKKSYNEDGSAAAAAAIEGLGEQTIITCKYWTTMNPCGGGEDDEATALFAANQNLFLRHGNEVNAAGGGNDAEPSAEALMEYQQQHGGHLTHLQQQFSCLLNKNASILNHVTMVTRPLTR